MGGIGSITGRHTGSATTSSRKHGVGGNPLEGMKIAVFIYHIRLRVRKGIKMYKNDIDSLSSHIWRDMQISFEKKQLHFQSI